MKLTNISETARGKLALGFGGNGAHDKSRRSTARSRAKRATSTGHRAAIRTLQEIESAPKPFGKRTRNSYIVLVSQRSTTSRLPHY